MMPSSIVDNLDDLGMISSTELDALHAEICSRMSAHHLKDNVEGDSMDVLDGMTIDEAFHQIQQNVASGSGCQVVKTIRRNKT